MNAGTYITGLGPNPDLLQIPFLIDGRLEVAALTNQVCKRGGPALHFKRLLGSDVELITNLFGSDARMAAALGQKSLCDFGLKLKRALAANGPGPSAARLKNFRGPSGENHQDSGLIRQRDLGFLPQLRYWPAEIRSFLTLAVVITADAASGAQNYGLYRVGIAADNQLTLNLLPGSGGAVHFQQWQQRKQPMPVAILLGADPALIFAAAASLPGDYAETRFCAWLQAKPVQLTSCLTVPLQHPINCQVLIEGWLDPELRLNEGPFGCFTGRYGGGNDCPVMAVSSISAVDQPIIPITLAGPLPMEDCWLARANLELIRARLSIDLPEITALEMPLDTAFHGLYFARSGDERLGAAELAAQMLQLDYLRGLKMLILLDAEEGLDVVNWRHQIQHKPSSRVWQQQAAALSGLLSPAAPALRHDPALIDALLLRLGAAGYALKEISEGGEVGS
jgi:4-hydroxy-3-polyprenylbenzoate decarboxylase